jgi:urease subunit gamma/beta
VYEIGVPARRRTERTWLQRRYDARVRLTAWEEERLLVFGAAELARRHRAAGLPLNAPEVVAVICDAMFEAARAGATLAEVEAAGLAAVKPGEAMDGVRELVDEIRLEVLLGDGTRLVALVDPLGHDRPMPPGGPGAIVPGLSAPGQADRERLRLEVRSTSRRTIRVSSHHPFDRVNARLVFDRAAAAGFRLDLPAGASEAWRAGETKAVELVRYGGTGGEGGDGEPDDALDADDAGGRG